MLSVQEMLENAQLSHHYRIEEWAETGYDPEKIPNYSMSRTQLDYLQLIKCLITGQVVPQNLRMNIEQLADSVFWSAYSKICKDQGWTPVTDRELV